MISTVDVNYHISQYKKTVLIQRFGRNTKKQYRYRKSVQIQKNGTDTGDQYEYKKQYNLEK